jgi:hypothetical protein
MMNLNQIGRRLRRLSPMLLLLSFAACATVRDAEPTRYSFSRSLLNVHHPALIADFLAVPVFPEIDDLPPTENAPTPIQIEQAKTPTTAQKPATKTAVEARPKPLPKPRATQKPSPPQRVATAIRAQPRTQEVLKSARRLAGLRMGRSQDFIRHILRVNDVGVKASSRSEIAERLLQEIKKQRRFKTRGTPHPGDFVFFEKTLPGYTSGVPSLVGVVDHVDRHGTIHFFAQVGEVVDRSVVTPRRPAKRRDTRSARVLNSYVRTKRSGDAEKTEYLAGQLLLGYGTF